MRILITGGSGFIGSNLIEHLAPNHEVTNIDIKHPTKKIKRMCSFIRLNILDLEGMLAALKNKEFDVLIHLAAEIDVRKSFAQPDLVTAVNVLGTVNALECCHRLRIPRFIFASSAARFGEPAQLPVKERTPCAPTSVYGASKLAAEHFIRAYASFGITHTILILANVYGPGQEGSAAIPSFIRALLAKKQAKIYGGSQTRDFVFVKDVVKAFEAALDKEGTFLIGSGSSISIAELYDKIATVLDSPIKPLFENPVKEEISHMLFDPSHAKQKLGWSAKTCIEEGLAETIEWFKS